MSNLIALYKALGGGWYSERPLVDAATREQMQQRTNWGDMLNEPGSGPADASLPANQRQIPVSEQG